MIFMRGRWQVAGQQSKATFSINNKKKSKHRRRPKHVFTPQQKPINNRNPRLHYRGFQPKLQEGDLGWKH